MRADRWIKRGAAGAAIAGALAIPIWAAARDDAPAPTATTEPALPRAEATLGCAERVRPALDRAVRGRDVIAGRVVFVGLLESHAEIAATLRRSRHGVGAAKAPVAVRGQGVVTIAIRPEHRGSAAFAYGADLRHAERIEDGLASVTFAPCAGADPRGFTGWAGLVMTTERQCVTVDVTEAAPRRTVVARLPLGIRRCPRA